MLRFFVIVAEIILLVLVLRSPFAQYLFEDVQNSISDWLAEMATMPERNELEALRESVVMQIGPLKPYQQTYLQEITVDKASLRRFSGVYCDGDDINPNFTGTKRAQLCLIIKQSSVLQSPN